MKNKKLRMGIGISVSLALMLSGCGEDNAENTGDIRILYTYSVEEGNTFRDVLAESAQEYAASAGVTIDFVLAEGDLEKQVNDIDTAAQKGYDAIICIPENAETARQLIAAADGLPIVFVNSAPEDDVLEADKYIYVGSDESVAGEYQAQYVLNKLNGAKNVVLLKGSKGHSATTGRTESLVRILAENGVTVVFNDYADFDSATARELFNVFLETGKSYDAVCCNNDAIALGVVQSMEEHGLNPSDVAILGVDATAAGCESIQKGDMCYTVYQSADGQGEYAARAAIELAKGGSIETLSYASADLMHVWVPFEEVDASNVKEYMDGK